MDESLARIGENANAAPIRSEEEERIIEEIETGSGGRASNDFFKKILTAETGEGSVEDYLSHPLNYNNSRSLAQIIRGVTGIFGDLRLAIVDIVIGTYSMFTKKEGASNG